MLQCVAVCCSVLQRVAVCCSDDSGIESDSLSIPRVIAKSAYAWVCDRETITLYFFRSVLQCCSVLCVYTHVGVRAYVLERLTRSVSMTGANVLSATF